MPAEFFVKIRERDIFMKMKTFLKLIVFVAISELAGIIGSVFSVPAISSWYVALPKPFLNPPNWVFGPVWTFLFALMGIAAFLVWQKGLARKDVRTALEIFVLQLMLNVLWSVIFFGQKNPGGAFLELLILWLTILATTILFWRISKFSGWLLVPYILWVSFAGYLNYSIWQSSRVLQGVAALGPCGSGVSSCASNKPDNFFSTSWATLSEQGVLFQYPVSLLTRYIYLVDWPPKIAIINQEFNCVAGGSETARAGKTQPQIINGHSYCVTLETGGAAGSIYTQYAYAFPRDGKTDIFTFSIRKVQCANYGEKSEEAACAQEQSQFSLDPIVDRMANSIQPAK